MDKRLIIDNSCRVIVERKSLKSLISKNELVRLFGSNNAIIATLVEEAGFEGVWLSSFEAHASCRLPDADLLTVSDYSNMCSKIFDRVSIPILMDGDAGGGSPINTIRMVREYEKNGAFGICIEDNKYPKRCSFYSGVKRELEDPRYHAMKIKAAKDNVIKDDFMIVARTESLIVGNSIKDAIDRSNIYIDHGADAILIHHKGDTPDKIFEFSDKFNHKVPLICVPTSYNQVTEKQLIDNGFSVVIYANYGIRAAVKAVSEILKTVAESGTLSSANDRVVSMEEIFRLICVDELKKNEVKYSI